MNGAPRSDAREYRVDTIGAEDVKFAIFGAIDNSLKKRILHLEPGTVGFSNFIPAEYLEEMLGRFMNAMTKGGAKEEFEQKIQGVDKDTRILRHKTAALSTCIR